MLIAYHRDGRRIAKDRKSAHKCVSYGNWSFDSWALISLVKTEKPEDETCFSKTLAKQNNKAIPLLQVLFQTSVSN